MVKGIRVVASDKDINSTDPQEYLYTSETLSPIVYRKIPGSIKLDASGNGQDLIPHDLGYPPIVVTYMSPTISIVNSTNGGNQPYLMPDSWGILDNRFGFCYSYNSNIRLYIQSSSGTLHANKTIKYVLFILVEPDQQNV